LSVIALIPARGGSKGIPRKNLALLVGKPLVAHAIETAKNTACVDRVLVSTDDSEIAKVAREFGAEVPFERPAELANDTAPMLEVVRHALAFLDIQGVVVEALVLLQPTSPLRTVRHIEESISLFRSKGATSVVSVVEVPHRFNPLSLMKMTTRETLVPYFADLPAPTRRQDKQPGYARNGPVVLVCNPSTIQSGELYGQMCVPYVMSEEESLDIDTLTDLHLAERLLLR
jgi:CMP-N,N'-diacetyllegionaminic acid synthase